ncbi:MAG TPA: TPM domain-containing protein, partial [Fimbriiglobus sp.]|nr:TPM domain-containing protein [Fimbriiglobus sp.]
MNKVLSVLAAAVLAGGWLTPSALASETSAGRMRVEDKAGAFTPEGVKKAEEAFANTSFKSPTHLTVVTVGEVPASRKADYEAAAKVPERRAQFFESWTRELAQTEREKGVFVLMFVDDKRYIVRAVTDKASDVHRSFTDADARALADKLSDGCKRALGQPADQAKATRDAALLDATSYVASQLKDTSVPAASETGRAASANTNGKRGGGTNIMGYVCIGLAVLLGIWLV